MKKILFSIWLLGLAVAAEAQGSSPRRGPIFGAFAGMEAHLLSAGGVGDYLPTEPYILFQQETAGLTVGAYGNWPLLEGLSLQPEIAFSFARPRATLRTDGRPVGEVRYTFADLELPLHLVLTNPVGRLPLRGSILFGGRLSLNLASGQPQPLEGVGMLRERLALDLGLGVEFRLHAWRLQPQVIYSHGLNNLHDDIGSPYDRSVDRILRDKIALRLGIQRVK